MRRAVVDSAASRASAPTPAVPRRILPVIVVSQLAGTSLWFAGNAVVPDLQRRAGLPPDAMGDITTAVQLGFIAGTLAFAVTAVVDRYSPRIVFLVCSLLGALSNVACAVAGGDLWLLLGLRFTTGFFLAGIYPVGMKIAAGWFDRELGKALGFLIGALVLGTASPHLIRALGSDLPWEAVMLSVSLLAAAGGLLMYALVPDGPHLRAGARFDPAAVLGVFRSADFRASAFGYFGHMWELYAFWAYVPAYLALYAGSETGTRGVSLATFFVVAAGAVGCIAGGLLSLRLGSARVAFSQLAVSGACCLLSPLALLLPPVAFLAFVLVWGVAVAGDSPQFSTLNARYAPPQLLGSALTIGNCIGFAITIASIQLLGAATGWLGTGNMFLLLVPGPVLGLAALSRLVR